MDYFPNPVPLTIIAVSVVMSIIAFSRIDLMNKWILSPYRIKRNGSYGTFITSGFIHADAGHLFFNMITFYFFAGPFEAIIGPMKFSIIYFAGMILSSLPTYIRNSDNPNYASLGASGAISGVVFGCILYNPLSRIYIMFIPVGIPAFIYGVLYLIYCVYASKKNSGNINHSAHFWGALSGLILTILFDPSVVSGFIHSITLFL